MSMTKLVSVAFVALAFMHGMSGLTEAEPLTVGAPPTLRAAFEEIVPIFQQEYRQTVTMAYTPSKAMLRQIEQGAPIDVFVSAGLEEVEHLNRGGLTLNGAPRVLAQTSLVLVMSADSPATLVSFPDALANHGTRIALGDPEISYLGEVTARVLSKAYPTYKNRAHILYGAHTEDILKLIRTGKAEVGLVYRANVINSADVRISDETPLGHEVRIQFGQAIVSTCRPSLRSVAEQFSDFLMTPRILRLLEKYGFDAPLPTGRITRSSPSAPLR
jgi:molybdate transport system substrate-binding protein